MPFALRKADGWRVPAALRRCHAMVAVRAVLAHREPASHGSQVSPTSQQKFPKNRHCTCSRFLCYYPPTQKSVSLFLYFFLAFPFFSPSSNPDPLKGLLSTKLRGDHGPQYFPPTPRHKTIVLFPFMFFVIITIIFVTAVIFSSCSRHDQPTEGHRQISEVTSQWGF